MMARHATRQFSVPELLGTPSDGSHLYVCAPAGFIDHVTGTALRLGWRAEAVHTEYFRASVDTAGADFTLHASRSGIVAEVPAGKTVAQVLVDHGVNLPLSWEQGICGACLVRVLDGVPDHRDLFQTDEEKALNTYMTPCCSRARSKVLVLDIWRRESEIR